MSNPVNIVILGANGQVGTEAALYLSMQHDVQITGMVRAQYGAILLQLAGIPWEVLDHRQISPAAAKVLSCADAVVDCTFPSGQQQQLVPLIESNTSAVMQLMKKDAVFIHSSSISAFGMPNNSPELKNYRFARTGYAKVKRLAEQRITQLGRQHAVRTAHLRLGQVHGVLQSVSRQIFSAIERGGLTAMGTPDSLCNIAFAHSVAEAYKQAAFGRLSDGQIETVVSNPQWSLTKLYDTYQQLAGRDFKVTYRLDAKPSSRSSFLGRVVRLATPFRSILESQVLPLFPRMVPRLKGEYRVQAVHRDRNVERTSFESAPLFNLIGAVPSTIVEKTRSSPEETIVAYRQIEARLEAALQNGVLKGC